MWKNLNSYNQIMMSHIVSLCEHLQLYNYNLIYQMKNLHIELQIWLLHINEHIF
jgi:hypothetical protein